MNTSKIKQMKIARRHKRIRATVSGTAEKPRLSVFRSNKFIYAQLIDDTTGATIIGISSEKAKGKNMTEKSEALGKMIAEVALAKKITKIAFDRGGFKYTGKIKLFADSARAGGLKF